MGSDVHDWPVWLPHPLWIRRQCPRCTSISFKQAEVRPYDGLLGLLGLRPVRCISCWRRYYFFTLHGAYVE